jgi:hypothetical protein
MLRLQKTLRVVRMLGASKDAGYAETMVTNAGMMLAMMSCYVWYVRPSLDGWARDKTDERQKQLA